MSRYSFILFIISQLSISAYCSENNDILAGKNTPVWFMETNPRDPEEPRLREIPNALQDAGLIDIRKWNETVEQRQTNVDSNVMYLEVLVVVDHGIYEIVGGDVESALKYVTSYFHSVDLRFRLIQSPKIRINIAGIILAKDPTAIYYVHQSRNERGSVIANKVLFEGGKYFLYQKKIKNHDIVVTLTSHDICSMNDIDVCYSTIVGLSLLGNVCHSHLSTAIVEDNGAFSGVIPTTHEIAHLLNVPHDGVGTSVRCPPYHGYIMSPSTSTTENNFKWSSCSQVILRNLPMSDISKCLKNKPNPGIPITRILPGKIVSAQEQCSRAGHGYACFNSERICNALSCYYEGILSCDVNGPAAEGTICGKDKICLNGECVSEN